jgi:hypothetical protein
VGMWESRRDFQRVWEGWEAGFMAFHAFHTLSFPWPAFRATSWLISYATCAISPTGHEMLVVTDVNECIGDDASVETTCGKWRTSAHSIRNASTDLSATPSTPEPGRRSTTHHQQRCIYSRKIAGLSGGVS